MKGAEGHRGRGAQGHRDRGATRILNSAMLGLRPARRF